MEHFDSWPPGGDDPLLQELRERYFSNLSSVNVSGLIADQSIGRGAVVSSFGAESVTLLHFVSRVRPELPVFFLDTGKHFEETIRYCYEVTELLDLNTIILRPDKKMICDEDPSEDLSSKDPSACCQIRKVFPLQDALTEYDFWISGRKRFQSQTRMALPIVERDGDLLKINPMAMWTREQIDFYNYEHNLPIHPLVEKGFSSIGCEPCTRAVRPGEDSRAGRWADMPEKTECGIHLGPDGKFRRA